MSYRMYRALFASFSAAALLLAASDGFARPGGAGPRGGVAAAHGPIGHGGRFHNRNAWNYWPGGGFYYGPSAGEPFAGAAQPIPDDIKYTYTYSYDVPWDHTHRFPPNVIPSDRPYVPSCPSETVIVPGRGGTEHSVNIMRCY